MTVGAFVAGASVGAIAQNANSPSYATMGILGGRGIQVSYRTFEEVIKDTDQFGDTELETIGRGSGYKVRFELLEVNPTNMSLLWNENNKAGGVAKMGGIKAIGRLGTSIASAFKATSIAGPPANLVNFGSGAALAAGPCVFTVLRFKLEENKDMVAAMSTDHRRIPIFARCLWDNAVASDPYSLTCFTVTPDS